MIKRSKLMWIFVIVTILSSIVLVLAFQAFPLLGDWDVPTTITEDYEPLGSGYFGYFQINPETLLSSLDEGKTDVFLPELRDMEEVGAPSPAMYNAPIPWRQADYIMIFNALNQFVWEDTLEDWSVYEMSFSANCQENFVGFVEGSIVYYKDTLVNGQKKYTTRHFTIVPEYLSAGWGGGKNFPHPLFIFDWKRIDIDDIKIRAEDALKTAEDNGGRDARVKINNKCYISVWMLPTNWRGWWVRIGNNFEVYIDSFTGEIIE